MLKHDCGGCRGLAIVGSSAGDAGLSIAQDRIGFGKVATAFPESAISYRSSLALMSMEVRI